MPPFRCLPPGIDCAGEAGARTGGDENRALTQDDASQKKTIVFGTPMIFRTPDDVLRAMGPLRADYYDVVRYTDGSAAFNVKRHYPADTVLGQIVTRQGGPAVMCLLRVLVKPPTAVGGVSGVRVSASSYNAWSQDRIGTDPWTHPYLTPDAVNRLRRAPIPVNLDFNEEFVWDTGEGRFQNEVGENVTGERILDWAYAYHCRTFARRFRIKYRIQSIVRTVVQRGVWRGQDWCLWLLGQGYEIRLKSKRQRGISHRYAFKEFERQTDKDGTNFFGFQSSKRAFFSNVMVLTVTCAAVYYLVPRFGILRAVYANPALTTVALACGFLIADQAVPFVLKGLVCGLSRLRMRVFSFLCDVKA